MNPQVSHDWNGLRQLCARLRAPGGCPWDRAQTVRSLTPYLLEEAHELLDAIDSENDERVAEELGDLLYLLVSVVTIAEEEGRFGFEKVARLTIEKLIRRHPNVFGATADGAGPGWESIKRTEDPARAPLASGSERLPALLEAYRVQEKAAGYGFDWPGPEPVLEKLDEERGELARALAAEDPRERQAGAREELGDLLFTAVNLSRHLGEDPEQLLRATVRKFRDRFAGMEAILQREGRALAEADLPAMEDAWQRAKEAEASPAPPPGEPGRRTRSS
jgi:MazG family protein